MHSKLILIEKHDLKASFAGKIFYASMTEKE
jgi:hypothetical protein